jgi:branched-chain amino acid transport system substrate-binding protein
MQKRTITAGAATGVVALALAACGGGPQDEGDDGISDGQVVSGSLTDQSGPLSELDGPNSVIAARMAIEDFQAAHPDEPWVEDIVQLEGDHQNDPAQANTIAQRMYDRENADLIVGVPNSAAAFAVTAVAEQYDRLMIGIPTGSSDFAGAECSPNAYLWSYNSSVMGNTIAHYLMGEGMDSWYILYPDYAYGQDYAENLEAYIEENGGEVVGSAAAPFPTDDFSSYMLTIQNLDPAPDVLMTIQSGSDLTNMMAAYDQFGLGENDTQLAVGALFLTDVASVGSELMQGSIQAAPWYWNQDERAREWSDRFLEEAGVRPTYAQASTYSAVTQYLEAILRAGTDDRAAVTDELDGTEFDDFFARNAYIRPEDHSVIKDFVLTQTRAPEDVTEDSDYLEVLSVLAGDDIWPAPSDECVLD